MGPDRRERELRARLTAPMGPEEAAASRRAWAVAAVALPADQRRRAPGWRSALALAALASVVAVGSLTGSREAVADLVRRAVGAAPTPPQVVPTTRLPGGGRLLIVGRAGGVVLGAGPPRRLPGPASAGSWSAAGRFVVLTGGGGLRALDASGRVRWRLGRPGARAAVWDPRDGFRVAYLVGGDVRSPAEVRVVAGDGTGDRRVGTAVPGVRPVWRPRKRHQLAWVAASGEVVLAALDRRRVVWRARTPSRHLGRMVQLAWSDDGSRLLVVGSNGTEFLSGESGAVVRRTGVPVGSRNLAGAWVPGSARAHVLTRRAPGGLARVVLAGSVTHGSRRDPNRTLLQVDGTLGAPVWSPDGRWLAVASGRADALLLLRPRAGRLAALRTVPGVRRRFGGGSFPRLEGWCCRG